MLGEDEELGMLQSSCTISRVAAKEDITCYAREAWQWCDGTNSPTASNTATCVANGDLPSDCEWGECPSGSQTTVSASCQGSDCEFPSYSHPQQWPSDCGCVEPTVDACSFACCPAGYFTAEPATCNSDNCTFPGPTAAGDWPASCPCVKRKFFYAMRSYSIAEEILGSWAGYDVFLKVEDDVSGPDGFLAVDNIKYHGAPLQCVDVETWTAYSNTSTEMKPGGFGDQQGWSRSNGAYKAGTNVACEQGQFWNAGTDGSCEYALCPTGAVTSIATTCRGDATVCKFPDEATPSQWPADCPCVQP